MDLKMYLDNYRKKAAVKHAYNNQLKTKQLFSLNESNIRALLDNIIIPKYKKSGIYYVLYKAKNTNSYYIKLHYNKTYVTARLSDHDAFTNIKGLVINKQIKRDKVIELFEQRIAALFRKSEAYLFKVIERQFNC